MFSANGKNNYYKLVNEDKGTTVPKTKTEAWKIIMYISTKKVSTEC